MVKTIVGYAGGTTENPTYAFMGDHSETVQMDYDPQKTTYENLLAEFWSAHDPTTPSTSRQYMSAIFYHNEEQRALALQSKAQKEIQTGKTIYTQILPIGLFTMAEDYHQKYRLRLVASFIEEFTAIYPKTEDLVASTAAARVNGYVAGYGTKYQLETEIQDLGLSRESQEKLLEMVRNRN